MDVLALPKKLGALQYRALVLPYRLVRPTFLADESALRLGYDRAIGALDEKVGALLGDEALVHRGQSLRKHADVVEKAVVLEAEAGRHAEMAASTREQGAEAVRSRRAAATREAGESVREAREDAAAAKERVARETAQREQVEKDRIEAAARNRSDAALQAERAEEVRIAAAEKAVTAAPKAQLDGALDELSTADEQRQQAEVLSGLADKEKARRAAEKAARTRR